MHLTLFYFEWFRDIRDDTKQVSLKILQYIINELYETLFSKQYDIFVVSEISLEYIKIYQWIIWDFYTQTVIIHFVRICPCACTIPYRYCRLDQWIENKLKFGRIK